MPRGAASSIHLVMGMTERDAEFSRGTLFTLLFVSTRAILGVHRKLVPTHSERVIWGSGDGSTLHVFDTGLGRLGGLICWEHWMPLARFSMHAKGEQVHVAAWPDLPDIHHVASRAYAFEALLRAVRGDVPAARRCRRTSRSVRRSSWSRRERRPLARPMGRIGHRGAGRRVGRRPLAGRERSSTARSTSSASPPSSRRWTPPVTTTGRTCSRSRSTRRRGSPSPGVATGRRTPTPRLVASRSGSRDRRQELQQVPEQREERERRRRDPG